MVLSLVFVALKPLKAIACETSPLNFWDSKLVSLVLPGTQHFKAEPRTELPVISTHESSSRHICSLMDEGELNRISQITRLPSLYRHFTQVSFCFCRHQVTKLLATESFPREVDKKSRGPKGERGLEFSRRKKFSSVAQRCLTLCDPMNCSTPGLPVHHQLPEFTQTHVHRASDAIQPSHPLSSPSPPAPHPSQHQSFPTSQLFA